jgi:hypothetical protein
MSQLKPRNPAIAAACKREIKLVTQVVQDKKKYNRKEKHKNQTKDH